MAEKVKIWFDPEGDFLKKKEDRLLCYEPYGADREQKENDVRNSFSYLLLLFSRGEMLKNFQAHFPGTMRVEQQLLYWNKGQSDRSTEAHQTTR
jgi:hypothetical protein